MKLFKLSTLACSLFLFSCQENDKVDSNNIHISVNNDSTDADIQINSSGAHIKMKDGNEADVNITEHGINVTSNDGKEADVTMTKEGIHVKSNDGKEADVNINEDGINIKSKDGNADVKMDKKGNMTITGPDGKELNMNMKELMEQASKK